MQSRSDKLKEENLNVRIKQIKKGFTCKARILLGPRVKVAALKEYKQELVEKLGLSLDDLIDEAPIVQNI